MFVMIKRLVGMFEDVRMRSYVFFCRFIDTNMGKLLSFSLFEYLVLDNGI